MAKKKENVQFQTPTEQDHQRKLRRVTEVFRKYGREIRAMIESQSQFTSEVDDVYQDLFVSMVENGLPDQIACMRAFLYSAIANRLASSCRKHKRHRRRVLVYFERSQGYRGHPGRDGDPLKHLMRIEQSRKALEMAEQLLPSHQAQAIVTHFESDAVTVETAEILGIHRRSVSRYICTGLQKLRQLHMIKEKEGAPE